eukprot:351617-Chlamydomonas_euryale.AAC.1
MFPPHSAPPLQASAGLRLVGASICVMVAGAVVFAARLTETLMPACVDLIGSSHNVGVGGRGVCSAGWTGRGSAQTRHTWGALFSPPLTSSPHVCLLISFHTSRTPPSYYPLPSGRADYAHVCGGCPPYLL